MLPEEQDSVNEETSPITVGVSMIRLYLGHNCGEDGDTDQVILLDRNFSLLDHTGKGSCFCHEGVPMVEKLTLHHHGTLGLKNKNLFVKIVCS